MIDIRAKQENWGPVNTQWVIRAADICSRGANWGGC